MANAKVCIKCYRAVPVEAVTCPDPNCEGTEFVGLILTPFWDSEEPYHRKEEEDNENKEGAK